MGYWHPSSTQSNHLCLLSQPGTFQTAAALEWAASFPISSFHHIQGRWADCKQLGSAFYTPPLTWEMHLGEGPYVIHTSTTRQREIFGAFYNHPLICRIQGATRDQSFLTLDGHNITSGSPAPHTPQIFFCGPNHHFLGRVRGVQLVFHTCFRQMLSMGFFCRAGEEGNVSQVGKSGGWLPPYHL